MLSLRRLMLPGGDLAGTALMPQIPSRTPPSGLGHTSLAEASRSPRRRYGCAGRRRPPASVGARLYRYRLDKFCELRKAPVAIGMLDPGLSRNVSYHLVTQDYPKSPEKSPEIAS